MSDGLELEVKLTTADVKVFEEVLSAQHMAGYALRVGPRRNIRDQYWDTLSGALLSRGAALRLRWEDEVQKITLKHGGSSHQGLFQRRELELPATLASWQAVRQELATLGIALEAQSSSQSEPSNWLAEAGLVVTQDRQTDRTILWAERDGTRVAELSLDLTRYLVGSYEVLFREIEVEATRDDTQHIVAIGAALRQRFGERVAPSAYGKYRRGLELATRLA